MSVFKQSMYSTGIRLNCPPQKKRKKKAMMECMLSTFKTVLIFDMFLSSVTVSTVNGNGIIFIQLKGTVTWKNSLIRVKHCSHMYSLLKGHSRDGRNMGK